MVAWLDYNFNGVFEPGEGRIITTIPSSASTQLVALNWPSFWVGYYPTASTWLRIRLTSTANGMTTSNMNGWAANGEVEDYPVIMGILLARNLVSFTAGLNSKKAVDLNWTLNTPPNFVRTVIERSKNSTQWDSLSTVNAADGIVVSYTATDAAPYAGTSYYRLKLVFNNGAVEYSDVRSVTLGSSLVNSLQIHLNPADQYTTLKITSSAATLTTIDLTDNTGRLLLRKQVSLTPGDNFVRVDDLGRFSAGLYYVAVKNTEFNAVEKLIIKRN
jgi:hypothetical protein